MATQKLATSHLPDSFYTVNPGIVSTTLSREQLKETLIATDGWIISQGRNFRIQSEHIGAGVYRVFLREQHE